MTDASQSPVVLVTGTSSGIGLHSAAELAEHGWRVIATMRDVGRADRLRDAAGEVDVRELDVTDDDSVRGVVQRVADDYGRLDAVVNNAGAAKVGTTEELPLAEFRAAMEVNFLGVVRVSQAAMPHLRASRGSLLTITSVGGVVGQPFNDAYCAAKFAAEGMLESLAPVARALGVRVTVLEPGAVASEFIANAGLPEEVPTGPYADLLTAYLQRTSGAFANAQAPREVAAVVRGILEQDDPVFRHQSSAGATAFAGLKLADLDGARVQATTRQWVGGARP